MDYDMESKVMNTTVTCGGEISHINVDGFTYLTEMKEVMVLLMKICM